jgi:hypothetical protein
MLKQVARRTLEIAYIGTTQCSTSNKADYFDVM